MYNTNGLLTEAKNQYITIKLERDKAGKLLKEWQDEHWVASGYDVTGNRLQVSSSYGAKVLSKRDKMGCPVSYKINGERKNFTANVVMNGM